MTVLNKLDSLNDRNRGTEVRAILKRKKALRKLYLEIYQTYEGCLKRSPSSGLAIEIGSGGGFAKEVIPELITTDIVPYEGIDQVLDATQLPFQNESLRSLFLWNVLHHIPNAEQFFKEALRVLVPGGRVLMIEPYPGIFGKIILKYFHHEPFDDQTKDWSFKSNGPLTGANGALPWMIFERDRKVFESKFPDFQIAYVKKVLPLRYWLTGGLKMWSLVPGFLYPFAKQIDHLLLRCSPQFGSFIQIELVK